MADNNASEYENSDFLTVTDLGDLASDTALYTITGILGTLAFIVLIYGVVSWCLIKKFRHFRNYVLLSAIAANGLYYSLWHGLILIEKDLLSQNAVVYTAYIVMVLYFLLCYYLWLLVLCYIFYVDFVKVFRLDIHRRYLKSSLLSWGMPFIVISLLLLIYYLLYNDNSEWTVIYVFIFLGLLLAPIAMNFIIYLFVLYSLFCSKLSKSTSTDKWSRFYISTLIFVLSNVSIFASVLLVINLDNLIIGVCLEILEYLNVIVIDLYIIVMKSNRLVWREYLGKRSKRTELELQ